MTASRLSRMDAVAALAVMFLLPCYWAGSTYVAASRTVKKLPALEALLRSTSAAIAYRKLDCSDHPTSGNEHFERDVREGWMELTGRQNSTFDAIGIFYLAAPWAYRRNVPGTAGLEAAHAVAVELGSLLGDRPYDRIPCPRSDPRPWHRQDKADQAAVAEWITEKQAALVGFADRYAEARRLLEEDLKLLRPVAFGLAAFELLGLSLLAVRLAILGKAWRARRAGPAGEGGAS